MTSTTRGTCPTCDGHQTTEGGQNGGLVVTNYHDPGCPTYRQRVAQETAEYIANDLMPKHAAFHSQGGVTIHYVDDKRPPTTIEDIKTALLAGDLWMSWMDDRVIAAMRDIHRKTDEN